MRKLFSLFCFSILLFTTISCSRDDDPNPGGDIPINTNIRKVFFRVTSTKGGKIKAAKIYNDTNQVSKTYENIDSVKWQSEEMEVTVGQYVGMSAEAEVINGAAHLELEMYVEGKLYAGGSESISGTPGHIIDKKIGEIIK